VTALSNRARVLDLGCGAGATVLTSLIAHGCQRIGVHFSRSSLREAQAQCPGVAWAVWCIGDGGDAVAEDVATGLSAF